VITDRPTVLVLGAGASLPYGYPSGDDLRRQIATNLAKSEGRGSYFRAVADAAGVSDDTVLEFSEGLLRSRRSSIDAFIESRAADYDLLGRCAIAGHLVPCEDDGNLFPTAGIDWYSPFLDAILGSSIEDFRRNALRIITFNFDRSFERALFLALQTNFKEVDLDEAVEVVPVLHIHGELGLPIWLQKYAGNRDARAYASPRLRTGGMLLEVANQIHIVHHPVEEPISAKAREWLGWADRIVFLGFSYHPLNLAKLGIPDSLQGTAQLNGTVYGMGMGQIRKAQRLTGSLVNFWKPQISILDVVQNEEWLYF
jgi:hypothetical protein